MSIDWHVLNFLGTNNAGSGGVELLETLNLMEFAGLRSSSFLTNSTGLYWFASIIRFSNFISSFLRTATNAVAILEREFQLDFSLQNRTSKGFAYSVWSQMSKPGGMDEINKKIKKLLGENDFCLERHYVTVTVWVKVGVVTRAFLFSRMMRLTQRPA